jgi:hypothetical protein
LKGVKKMPTIKDLILGICIAGGVILVLLGIGAVSAGNKWWPAYFIAGIPIALVFIKVAFNDYKRNTGAS